MKYKEDKLFNILFPRNNIQTVLCVFFLSNQSALRKALFPPGSRSESEVNPGNEVVLLVAVFEVSRVCLKQRSWQILCKGALTPALRGRYDVYGGVAVKKSCTTGSIPCNFLREFWFRPKLS